MTDRLFSNDIHLVFGSIMSETVSDFSKATFVSTTHKKEQLRQTDKFAAFREIWEIVNSTFSNHVAPSEYLSIDETLYPMRQPNETNCHQLV